MLEKQLEKKCSSFAFDLGIQSMKLVSVSYRGAPDRIFFIGRGIVWFVEFKSKGKNPRENQLELIKYLSDNYYVVDVIDSIDAFKHRLKEILKITFIKYHKDV